jgi:hypothetical protein
MAERPALDQITIGFLRTMAGVLERAEESAAESLLDDLDNVADETKKRTSGVRGKMNKRKKNK